MAGKLLNQMLVANQRLNFDSVSLRATSQVNTTRYTKKEKN